jgi:CheY-like chemotaxis protein
LTRALHKVAPRQPILLATSSTIDLGVEALADAGISDVLRRPLASTELAVALARCLRSPGALQT